MVIIPLIWRCRQQTTKDLTMKLELPDNNPSVLFHMGNALQSIASDLDATYTQNPDKVWELANSGKPETKRLEISDIVAAVKASLDEAVELGLIGEPELSDTVDKMIDSVAADWKVPVNRLTGNTTDAEQYGKSVLSDCLDSIESIGIIRQQASDATVEVSDTIDADGLPWDRRIHSSGASERSRTSKNTWRMARKPKDKTDEEWAEYVEGVKTELRALMAIPVATDVNGVEFRQLSGEIHNVEINGTLEFPPIVDSATFEAVANSDIGAGQPVRIVTPPVVDAVVTPPVVDAVVTPPVVDAVVTPPVVDAVVTTGPTTFPELMKFITVNNKKLTKESVDEALKAQGLASIALLAARTDLIPRVHAALVKLL